MAEKRNIWISPRDGRWAVQHEESDRASRVFDTQEEAVEYGRELGKNNQVELIVQGEDGTIQSRDSYGSDPYPPEDTEH